MAFLQNLQQKLRDVYREFPEDIEEICIQMRPEKFIIATPEQTIEVLTETVKRINFTPYLLDLYNTESDFDFVLYAEDDLKKLLQYIDNTHNPNGKRLLAYSLLETKMNSMIHKSTKKKVIETVK
jgi:hypothetical protein